MDTPKSHLDNARTRQAKTQSIQLKTSQFKSSVIEIFDDRSFFSELLFNKTKKRLTLKHLRPVNNGKNITC